MKLLYEQCPCNSNLLPTMLCTAILVYFLYILPHNHRHACLRNAPNNFSCGNVLSSQLLFYILSRVIWLHKGEDCYTEKGHLVGVIYKLMDVPGGTYWICVMCWWVCNWHLDASNERKSTHFDYEDIRVINKALHLIAIPFWDQNSVRKRQDCEKKRETFSWKACRCLQRMIKQAIE